MQTLSYFNVYPNPAKDYVSFEITLQHLQDCSVQLVNALGQIIETKNLTAVKHAIKQFDTHHLPNGIYWIKININEQSKVLPLTIKK